MRERRILEVCAVDFTAYHLLRPLMHGLRSAGWTVEFACADGPFAAMLRAEGFRHRAIPIPRRLAPLRQLFAIAVLIASLVRRRPDLVHTHTPIGGLVGRVAAALTGVPVVHTFHGLPLPDPTHPTAIERAFLVAERTLARWTRAFFSQAAADVERAIALGIARRDRILVIGNGVDVVRFAPRPGLREDARAALGLTPDSVLLVTVARLVREKGLLDLAEASKVLAAEPRLHVAVIGAALPSDRSDITAALATHEAASRLGPRWRLLGHRSDVDVLLNAADIFVLPSHREGLPRSVIEAMATGLPIIATDIPACRELVSPGDNGLLVPVGNPPALAQAIDGLMRDEPRRGAFGRRSREIALQRHDERQVIALQLVELDRAVGR